MAISDDLDLTPFVQGALERAADQDLLSDEAVVAGVTQNLELLFSHFERVSAALSEDSDT